MKKFCSILLALALVLSLRAVADGDAVNGGVTGEGVNFEDRIFGLTPSASSVATTQGKDNVFQMCFIDPAHRSSGRRQSGRRSR